MAFVAPDSPPANSQPLTKRDVRRNRIMERLQSMIDNFSGNQHQHYRAQLQAVQVDMALVLRADPYPGSPLDDSGDDIRQLIDSLVVGQVSTDEAAQRDFYALAGSRYREFAREVNDSLEARDSDLTALHNHYLASIAELERNTQQRLHQAEEEHKALANTIRQRLITTLSKKRGQLLRDKEQLDIADSNSLLLNPSQFSINHPGSPGPGQNRKTRHLRHRANSPGEGGEIGKRKRKLAGLEDEGNESPASGFRIVPPDALGGGRSPFKDARTKEVYTQFEAPAYSLERLFTDKELALATATAQQATYRHFHQPQQSQRSNGNGTGDQSVDGETGDGAEEDGAAPTTETATDTPPASAPEMERTTSHQVLTRGGARANPLAALSDLATAAAASTPVRDNPFAPVIPTYHAVSRVEKSGAPPPSSVTAMDAENDFEMMRRAGDPAYNFENEGEDAPRHHADAGATEDATEMRRQLLQQAIHNPTVTQPYRFPLLETGPALVGKGIDRPAALNFAPQQPAATAAESRARVSLANHSLGNLATLGSMAAALQGKLGGEPMSRTTSAGGASDAPDPPVTRRGRARLV